MASPITILNQPGRDTVLAPPGLPKPEKTSQYKSELEELVNRAVQKSIEPYREEVNNLKKELFFTKKELQIVKNDLVKLEGYSRKDNLKFYGINESPYETKFDCKRTILQILEDSNISLPRMALESAHRIGPKYQHQRKPRPIIVKFFHGEEKELVIGKSQHIWYSTGIRVEEDFAVKIEAERKVLKPILFAAKKSVDQAGKHDFNAKLNLNKLSLNGKVYTAKDVDKLPSKLHPANLATQNRGNITAFFTSDSPLSNHYQATQVIDNQVYNCNEQFFMQQKALTFNDYVIADSIMKESNPGKQKGLGRKITNFDQNTWNSKCLEVMKVGLQAKFSQNEKLKTFLLETGISMLLEANPKDSFWGVGLSMRDNLIWKKNSWVQNATNHLGVLLSDLRRDFNREITANS